MACNAGGMPALQQNKKTLTFVSHQGRKGKNLRMIQAKQPAMNKGFPNQ